MMRSLRYLSFLLLIILISGCTENKTDKGPVLSVTIPAFEYFAGRIAGEHYSVNIIVPPGSSPATFEPGPSVVREIAASDLLIIDGYLGFELAWKDKLTGINPDMEVLVLADNQELIKTNVRGHSDHSHDSGIDPHFWVSPKSALIIASSVYEFLLENDPDNAEDYKASYLDVLKEIEDTDNYVKEKLGSINQKAFMIFHPALTYLARDYDLVQYAIEIEGKEPSISDLKQIIDKSKELGIKLILVQKEFDLKNAGTVADEIGAKTAVIDPLGADWPQMIRQIAEYIFESNKENSE